MEGISHGGANYFLVEKSFTRRGMKQAEQSTRTLVIEVRDATAANQRRHMLRRAWPFAGRRHAFARAWTDRQTSSRSCKQGPEDCCNESQLPAQADDRHFFPLVPVSD